MYKSKEPNKFTEKEGEGIIMRFARIAQVILIFLCSILFLLLLFLYCAKTLRSNEPKRLEIVLATDSTGVVTPDAICLADSLIKEIRKQETILEEKYKYFIEQQSNVQDLLAIGGVVLGIIVSLVGFFGFSTMKSIEDKAKKIGEESADQAFNKRIKELQDKEYQTLMVEKFGPDLERRIKDSQSRFELEHTALIKDHSSQLNLLKETVSSLVEKVNKKDNSKAVTENSLPNSSPKEEPDVFGDING